MRQRIWLSLVLLVTTILALACGSPADQGQQQAEQGQQLVETRCAECHTLDRVTAASKSQQEWADTVDRMIERGASLDEQERESVIDYLAENHGP
jgi:mono/diheme cytochrome c family protein